MDELVSIVVTSYNHAEYLDQRMQSLLAQTYTNIEIIVVDDASKDNSVQVLDKYRSKNNIRVFALQDNVGAARATNYGVQQSKGKYIMFAECDDFSEKNQVEQLVRAFDNNENIGVVFSKSNIVNAKGGLIATDYDFRERSFKEICANNILIPRRIMQRFLLNSCVLPNMSAAMIRRKTFDDLSRLSDKYKVCLDWDFWCRASRICDFYYLSKALNNFRTHESTARNLISSKIQIIEYYELLYPAAKYANLNLLEKLIFRINTGKKWAAMIRKDPSLGIKSFFKIFIGTFPVEKLNILFLFLGFTDLFVSKILRSARKG